MTSQTGTAGLGHDDGYTENFGMNTTPTETGSSTQMSRQSHSSTSGSTINGKRSTASNGNGQSQQATPTLSPTPPRQVHTVSKGATFQRTLSTTSPTEDHAAIAFRNLLSGKLLITQSGEVAADDDNVLSFLDGRTSRDTDYETDLDMDYDEWIAEDNHELDDHATQEEKYVHMCNETGVVAVTYFLEHIHQSKFKMKYHGLGPLGAKAIAMPLKDNQTIETLDLEGNWVEREGATYIAEMLKENMYLSEINLAENRLGLYGGDAICQVLQKNDFVKELNLSGNDLQNYGAEQICQMLSKNHTLKRLYLAHNKFEERAAFHFKEALSHNETLETLDLSWNHFRTHGAVALAEGVQENYGLKSLNVSMNGFGDAGAEAMGRALKHNRWLSELDVSHNRIPDDGAGHIALGLQTNDVLKVLKIGYNPIGEDGTMALLVAISKNDMSCMTRLDLSDVFVSKEFRELQRRLESDRPFSVIHGGVLLQGVNIDVCKQDPLETFRRDPYGKLKSYAKAAGYRLMDLFKEFDKDGSMSISKDELIHGLKSAGIEITRNEINMLIQNLDTNSDGMIDYSELLEGDKTFRELQRSGAECPDNRKVQRSANRISRNRSEFLDEIIDV